MAPKKRLGRTTGPPKKRPSKKRARKVAASKPRGKRAATDVRGVVTNIPFLSALVTHPSVAANTIDTGFIERELKTLAPAPPVAGDLELAAAVAAIVYPFIKNVPPQPPYRSNLAIWIAIGWLAAGILVLIGLPRRVAASLHR